MSEYDFNEDDLKPTGGGGDREALPIGEYTFSIEKAETKRDKNGKAYLSLELEVAFGNEKKRKAWDNYLTFDKTAGGFKRTASFLRAIGHKNGVPVGAPEGRPASDLVGTYVDAQVTHEYQDVPGHQYSVQSWSKDFAEIKESGALDGIKPTARLGFYSVADEFEGIGGGSNSASDEEWG